MDFLKGTENALQKLNLSDLVDVVVCGDDAETEPKPSPHNALKICTTLGIHPKNAFVVGDTMADISMGKSAKLGGTIGVLSGVATKNELSPHADHVVPNVASVLPIVLARETKERLELWEKQKELNHTEEAKKYQEYLDSKGTTKKLRDDYVC